MASTSAVAPGSGSPPQTPSWKATLQQSSIYRIFKASIVCFKEDPRNAGLVLNVAMCGAATYRLIQQGFTSHLGYDLLTHTVTIITYLAPTKEGTIIGGCMNAGRIFPLMHRIFFGKSSYTDIIDCEIHVENILIYLSLPNSPSLFGMVKGKLF